MSNVSLSYTQEALELWFQKLTQEWENAFTDDELLSGREIYRSGEVTGLDLAISEAIVSRRIERKEHYSVIEWNGGSLEVRCSTTDAFLGRSLAVAGLYEIGEVICDEASPLPPDPPKPITKKEDLEKEIIKPSAEEPTTEVENKGKPKARLRLRIRTLERGLTCKPIWMRDDGRELPAFGKDARPRQRGIERESLVRLAVLAGKANFNFRASVGEFALETWAETAEFIENHLTQWEKRFDLIMEGDSALLRDRKSV
ncbi:MAG: hypothetical protein VB980_05540, partial [Opitutales bacterium]